MRTTDNNLLGRPHRYVSSRWEERTKVGEALVAKINVMEIRKMFGRGQTREREYVPYKNRSILIQLEW